MHACIRESIDDGCRRARSATASVTAAFRQLIMSDNETELHRLGVSQATSGGDLKTASAGVAALSGRQRRFLGDTRERTPDDLNESDTWYSQPDDLSLTCPRRVKRSHGTVA